MKNRKGVHYVVILLGGSDILSNLSHAKRKSSDQ